MRPEIARAAFALAASALAPPAPARDAEGQLWRLYEDLFRREYRDERGAVEWIDLGGEAG